MGIDASIFSAVLIIELLFNFISCHKYTWNIIINVIGKLVFLYILFISTVFPHFSLFGVSTSYALLLSVSFHLPPVTSLGVNNANASNSTHHRTLQGHIPTNTNSRSELSSFPPTTQLCSLEVLTKSEVLLLIIESPRSSQ